MRIGVFIERESACSTTDVVSVEATYKDEILLEEMRRRFDLQQSEIDAVISKAGLVLAYMGTVLVLLVTTMGGTLGSITLARMPVFIVAFVTLLVYIAGVFCCIKVIAPWTFFFPIGVEEQEVEFYISQNRDDMVLQILRQYSEYIQKNICRAKNRSSWFLWSLIFGLVFTVLGVCTAYLA